jgi:hypothetical protein
MEPNVSHHAKVLASLLEAVLDVQVASGRSAEGVGSSTAVFGGIEGFTSLNALEVLVMVGAKLNEELPDELLARKDDGSPLTVGDLTGRIVARMEGDDGNE